MCPTRTRSCAPCGSRSRWPPGPPRSRSPPCPAIAAGQLLRIHEDVAHLAPGLLAAGLLDGEAFRRLSAFDRHHEDMSDDDALWSEQALRGDPRWDESRSLAAAALAAL